MKINIIGSLILCLIVLGTIEVKFYSNDIDKGKCLSLLNSIDSKYYEGVKRINVYPKNTNSYYYAYWWPSGKINLYNGCNINDIQHELAHQINWNDGIKVNHGEEFKKALGEIK